MGKSRASFSKGVGGPRTSWSITDLREAWITYEKIVEVDPNDLERFYAAGLAMQMAGEDACDDEYMKFCKAAEAYHVSVEEATKYYNGIAEDMKAAGVGEEEQELFNIRGRVKLLTRYAEMRKKDKSRCVLM